MKPSSLQTERLTLRPWREQDFELFAQLNSDPKVMEYFPGLLSRENSDLFAHKVASGIKERGWGLWAVEVPGVADFIGFIGLAPVNFDAAFTPAIEVGWRIAHPFWGRGYAPEGARAVLKYAFEQLGLEEIVSFTAVDNQRSRKVMEKIGMYHDPSSDFDHPRLSEGHKLRRHVLYRIKKNGQGVRVTEYPPENFQPRCEAAACYVEIDGKILIMERAITQSEGQTWGVPAGKIEPNEMPLQAALRELFEETNIRISPSQIKAIGKLYVQKPKISYIYHMFQVHLSEIPEVKLSSEHTRFLWATPQELEPLPLIGGAKESLQYFHQKKTTP